MYYYIFDSFVSEKKYQTLTHQIENRLMQLGISGHMEKLTMLKSLEEMVKAAIKNDAKTIVAVGNDDTVSKIISFLPKHAVTFGIIPVGDMNGIADKLGIPHGVAACDTISARITTKIDLGKVNNAYFISSIQLPESPELKLNFGTYNISTLSPLSHVRIYNINGSVTKSSPTDGTLEAVVSEEPERQGLFGLKRTYSRSSVFPVKKVTITTDHTSLPVIADGQLRVKTPVTVEVAPQKLKIIVGKNRMF
ncbi:MAG: diacylglycerol/lipid kinase family protein [Patescibacteria group bacterium]